MIPELGTDTQAAADQTPIIFNALGSPILLVSNTSEHNITIHTKSTHTRKTYSESSRNKCSACFVAGLMPLAAYASTIQKDRYTSMETIRWNNQTWAPYQSWTNQYNSDALNFPMPSIDEDLCSMHSASVCTFFLAKTNGHIQSQSTTYWTTYKEKSWYNHKGVYRGTQVTTMGYKCLVQIAFGNFDGWNAVDMNKFVWRYLENQTLKHNIITISAQECRLDPILESKTKIATSRYRRWQIHTFLSKPVLRAFYFMHSR